MQTRTTYSLVTTLLLTVAACARQEDPEYFEDDEEMEEIGGSSSGGTGSKAGGTSVGKSGSTSAGNGGGTTLPPSGTVGGKGGSKATGGTGGKASGGSAGSSSGSGGGGEDPVNMPVDGLSVTFKAIEGDSADFVGGDLFVHNDSAETFSLPTIKIRYYFTNELNSPPAFVWNWGQFGPTSNLGSITCTGQTVEMPSPKPGANFYIELSCPDGTFASGNLLKTSWKAGNQGSGKLTQSDDWSFIAAEGEAPKVVVMDGNTIIWGVEP